MECEACRPKGPAWPNHLDYSTLKPYETCCPWCNGTKEVTAEVNAVYQRLKLQTGVLCVRMNTLKDRALTAQKTWEDMFTKKRPKGFPEKQWATMLDKAAETAVYLTHEALNAKIDYLKAQGKLSESES